MRMLLTAACVLVIALPAVALAQDGAIDPSKVLAPYVDESTYLIGVVDLQNVGMEALLERFAKVGMPKEQVAQMKLIAVQTRDDLVRAGGRFVCFTASLDDPLAVEPLLVIPVGKGGKAQAIADVLDKLGIKVRIKGDTVLAGKATTLERALVRKPAAVPELAKALAAVEAMPARLAITAPPAFRSSLDELMPHFPKEFGDGAIAPLMRGLRWGAAGIDLSAERRQLCAVVQARNAETAAELRTLTNRLLELMRAHLDGLPAIRPEVKDDQLRIVLDSKALDAVVLPAIAKVREAAARTESTNNLKRIGFAMHGYNDTHKSFPAQASYDKNEKPLLSWRVHLLPYLDQEALYKQFKLDEPWDSAANKPLIAKMPSVFRSPNIMDAAPGKTTYLVPVGPALVFDGPKKTKITEIPDGTSNTILVVEADDSRAVWWTQPGDYVVDRKNPKAGLLRPNAAVFLAALADGSVRAFSRAIPDETMWLYFHPSDGQAIPDE